ncbi:MAG: zinc-dependent metalloprotease [Solirubrobacteraceae bacterium]|nr:zinc-dependent metalloprotease [Solirubrobacteraceae bacterium]
MIDRALTQRIANAVSRGTVPGARSGQPATAPEPLPGDLSAICADAETRVVEYTGLLPAAPLPPPEAVPRSTWIAANVASMGAMLDPLGDKLPAGGVLGGAARSAVGTLLSAEAGALTGYLSQRVLGQYEFTLVDPDAPARLLFVEPNIAEAARRLDADAEQLLTWIAFHEVTHAVQFAGVPWLRPYLAGLLRELLASLDVKLDPRALLKVPSREDARGLVDAVKQNGLVGMLAGGERRELLERVQGVMGVVEGHAEHVMDVVGAAALPSLDELRTALDRRRRERPPLLALLERLIGLEAKMRQYEDGKRFCDAVVATAGPVALHRVFDAPEQLPSVAELHDPEAWMRRTGAAPAAV